MCGYGLMVHTRKSRCEACESLQEFQEMFTSFLRLYGCVGVWVWADGLLLCVKHVSCYGNFKEI